VLIAERLKRSGQLSLEWHAQHQQLCNSPQRCRRRLFLVFAVAPNLIAALALPGRSLSHAHLLGTGRSGASQLCTDWMVERNGFELPVPLVSGASGRFLSVSVLCQRRSARLKLTGERLASDSDQSDVYVCPRKGAGRHETQSIRVGN
jgi:hypothetical protein